MLNYNKEVEESQKSHQKLKQDQEKELKPDSVYIYREGLMWLGIPMNDFLIASSMKSKNYIHMETLLRRYIFQIRD